MKRSVVILTAVLLVAGVFPLMATGGAEASGSAGTVEFPRFVDIATAGTGGAYYPIGIAMAEILSDVLPTQATAQVTGGAVENIRLMQNGDVSLALTTSASAFKGTTGQAPFDRVNDRVMGLFSNLTQGVYQIAVLEDSNIETLADLKGKRVSLGPAGGLGVELSGYVLGAAGSSIDDIRATYLSYSESASMMADGNLDAVVIQTAMPNPAIRELEAQGRTVRIVPLPESVIEAVTDDHPYFARFVIPTSMYDQDSEVATLNSFNMCVVDRELSEDVVYEITKAFMENIDRIQASHPAAKNFAVEDAPAVPIELHPGAARYYREIGVIN